MELNTKSIQETIEKLQKVKDNIKEVEKPHSYSFREIFTDDFIEEYTNSKNIQEFLYRSGFDFSQDAKAKMDSAEFSEYVAKNTKFSSWEEMKVAASKILLSKKIMN